MFPDDFDGVIAGAPGRDYSSAALEYDCLDMECSAEFVALHP
jgi:hypothetical protein